MAVLLLVTSVLNLTDTILKGCNTTLQFSCADFYLKQAKVLFHFLTRLVLG